MDRRVDQGGNKVGGDARRKATHRSGRSIDRLRIDLEPDEMDEEPAPGPFVVAERAPTVT